MYILNKVHTECVGGCIRGDVMTVDSRDNCLYVYVAICMCVYVRVCMYTCTSYVWM